MSHRPPLPLIASACIALWALTSIGCRRDGESPPTRVTVRIAAAASLRELVEGTTATFRAAHPEVELEVSFGASSALARQIEMAGAFDAFLSADAANVERVASRLAQDSIRPFLSNRMVMIARGDLADPVDHPDRLRDVTGTIALAGEAVPAGRYARILLGSMDLQDGLAARIVSTDSVRATLAMVEAGSADYGFVYLTDAAISPRVRRVWTATPAENPGIVYMAGAVAGADAAAFAYVRFLADPAFQQAAAALGFLPPP